MPQLTAFLRERFSHKAQQHFDELLRSYRGSGLAPPNLLQEVTSGDDGKLWAHVWEAMLFRHLSSLNFQFVPNRVTRAGQDGPDFGVRLGGATIWIEANVPAPVDIPDEWLKPAPAQVREKPSERMLLRWTLAIERKAEAFERYLAKGIIGQHDALVIAINSCRLSDFPTDDHGASQLPFAVEAVFPIGPLGIPLKKDGRPDGPAARIPRFFVNDRKGAEISTSKFLDPNFTKISAVLGGNARHMLDGELRMVVVHNPLAVNPMPKKALGPCTEFFAERDGDDYLLRNVSA